MVAVQRSVADAFAEAVQMFIRLDPCPKHCHKRRRDLQHQQKVPAGNRTSSFTIAFVCMLDVDIKTPRFDAAIVTGP